MRNPKRLLLASCLLLAPHRAQASDAPQADFLVRGGRVADGSGSPPVAADVAIRGDRIVAVGKLHEIQAREVIDATGLIIAPGFIDLHTHSDESITRENTRPNLNYLLQGVTTIVTGNCGGGASDVGQLFEAIESCGAGTNVVHLAPHGTLRRKVVGDVNRPATPEELEQLRELLDHELQNGAWGMSTGLIYTPGCYAPTEELVELARVVAARGGIYASHIRGEGAEELLDAIDEAIRIGRESGAPVHISHLKASGRPAWGMVREACQKIEDARAAGQAVTADQYPYTASSTSIAAMTIPTEAREGDNAALLRRLDDPETGPALRQRITETIERRGGGSTIRIAAYAKRPDWVGRPLDEIAANEGHDVVEIVVEIQRHGGASGVSFGMAEEDVRAVMQKPYVATASDGSARIPDDTRPHPRSYGCFPRKIGRYALEEHVIPLEFAIRSSSGLPADILGLRTRGYVRADYVADLVAFDPNTFRDAATFDDPHRYATGTRYVWVGGKLAIRNGEFTGTLAGKPLRRP